MKDPAFLVERFAPPLVRDPGHALQGPAAGALLETAILGELLRTFANRGRGPGLYFWKTERGEGVGRRPGR